MSRYGDLTEKVEQLSSGVESYARRVAVAHLLLAGHSREEIAKKLGMTKDGLGRLLSSPSFLQYMGSVRKQLEGALIKSMADVEERLNALVPSALDFLQAVVEGREEASVKDRLTAARLVLDHATTVPERRTQEGGARHLHFHLDHGVVDRVKKVLQEMKRAEIARGASGT